MNNTHNVKSMTARKHGFIGTLIVAISISALVGTSSIAMAGAKQFQNQTEDNYSKDYQNNAKSTGRDQWDPNWGNLCNNYGPPGSINYHGNSLPKECFNGSTYNPFASIYDLIR